MPITNLCWVYYGFNLILFFKHHKRNISSPEPWTRNRLVLRFNIHCTWTGYCSLTPSRLLRDLQADSQSRMIRCHSETRALDKGRQATGAGGKRSYYSQCHTPYGQFYTCWQQVSYYGPRPDSAPIEINVNRSDDSAHAIWIQFSGSTRPTRYHILAGHSRCQSILSHSACKFRYEKEVGRRRRLMRRMMRSRKRGVTKRWAEREAAISCTWPW